MTVNTKNQSIFGVIGYTIDIQSLTLGGQARKKRNTQDSCVKPAGVGGGNNAVDCS